MFLCVLDDKSSVYCNNLEDMSVISIDHSSVSHCVYFVRKKFVVNSSVSFCYDSFKCF